MPLFAEYIQNNEKKTYAMDSYDKKTLLFIIVA